VRDARGEKGKIRNQQSGWTRTIQEMITGSKGGQAALGARSLIFNQGCRVWVAKTQKKKNKKKKKKKQKKKKKEKQKKKKKKKKHHPPTTTHTALVAR